MKKLILNCTEGGARIKGTVQMSLAKADQEYSNEIHFNITKRYVRYRADGVVEQSETLKGPWEECERKNIG